MSKVNEEEGRDSMRRNVRENVKNALINGDILLLNIDDSPYVSQYDELFDPDLQQIIHHSCFPNQLFQPHHFKKKFEIWKNFRRDEEVPLNKDYIFVI
mmetsp:Transcript_23566/g.3890  ORF Transcript_23566/g.3890 Transcript_23566/m.3890 type:complete len:98 (+) Transcript_23566:709-1002(+)